MNPTQQEKHTAAIENYSFPISLVFAYFLGVFGFHISWFILLFFVIWYIVERFKITRQLLLREFTHQVISVKDRKESNHWFNIFVYHLWPHMNPFLSEKLKASFEEILEQYKGFGVQAVRVVKVNFGKTPIMTNNLNIQKTEFGIPKKNFDKKVDNEFTLVADVLYDGEAEIVLDIEVGGKLINIHCPIVITNFNVSGRMKFDFVFTSRWPFMHCIDMAFKQRPQVDISLLTYQKFDLMALPWFKSYVVTALENAIARTMVAPAKYTYYLPLWPPKGEVNLFPGEGLFDPYSEKKIFPRDPLLHSDMKPTKEKKKRHLMQGDFQNKNSQSEHVRNLEMSETITSTASERTMMRKINSAGDLRQSSRKSLSVGDGYRKQNEGLGTQSASLDNTQPAISASAESNISPTKARTPSMVVGELLPTLSIPLSSKTPSSSIVGDLPFLPTLSIPLPSRTPYSSPRLTTDLSPSTETGLSPNSRARTQTRPSGTGLKNKLDTKLAEVEKVFGIRSKQRNLNLESPHKTKKMVLHVNLMEAVDMSAGDPKFLDAYCIVQVGSIKYTTPIAKGIQDPKWNTHFEFPINPDDYNQLIVECWNKENIKDSFLGKCIVNFDDIITATEKGESKVIDQWVLLKESSSSLIHLRMYCTVEES